MNALYLSKNQFKQLKPLDLREFLGCEASFVLLKKNRLIKIYKNLSKKELQNKVKTIYSLEKNQSVIGIPELIVADEVVFVNGDFVGISYPLIEGCSTEVVFSSNNISIDTKINILKQIGSILEKMAYHYNNLGLAFGDVHPGNFIYNGTETLAIDTDSLKIGENIASPSRYLMQNPNLSNLDKYQANAYGVYIPNTNTDILSFIMMVLDVITNEHINTLDIKTYMKYLDHLNAMGFNTKFIEACASIYDNKIDNINPLPYLDDIKKRLKMN